MHIILRQSWSCWMIMESTRRPLGHLPVSFSPLSFVFCVCSQPIFYFYTVVVRVHGAWEVLPHQDPCAQLHFLKSCFLMDFYFMLGKHNCIEHTGISLLVAIRRSTFGSWVHRMLTNFILISNARSCKSCNFWSSAIYLTLIYCSTKINTLHCIFLCTSV